ncbi:terminase small subunit [Rhodobacter phage RcCWillis]|nr:terminase small subunit [Rhodobacter phage RcCWillis]
MTTDLSDLFSDPQPEKPVLNKDGSPRKKMGRPTREEALAKAQAQEEPIPHYSVFRQPVGITFLAKIVGKQPRQIEKRLEKCPVATWMSHKGNQVPMYDFLTAMAYLIPPRGNIEDWFAQQNAASLPPYVNKMWWDSAHQRNRVMLSSNDLWHTDDVMVVFGRVAMTIRQEVKMWVEDLPEKELLTDAQYTALVDAGNRLVDEIREQLTKLPSETFSMSAHINQELESSGRQIDDADRADEDDEE